MRIENSRHLARALAAILLACISCAAAAPDLTPLGLWTTIDDRSGKVRSEVRIYERDGALHGRIEKIILPGKHNRCVACTDERRDQPALGLVIIRDMKRDGEAWTGGDVLDPENGRVYAATLRLEDEGRVLRLRGFIGVPLFGRTQTWTRAGP